MAKFWLCAAVGLYVLPLCLAQISLNISCRYAGVFHVEKNRRYSLTREEAIELCKALNSTLPTWEQMTKAFSLGLETCRYGYIEEKIVVPRHNPYHLCAANTTGIYILQSNVSDRYDTYCFNSSEIRPRVCDPVTELYSSWPDNQSIIEISNADGTRYIGGSLYTEMPPFTDDDSSMGSGSANDRGTTDPNVIRSDVFHTSPSEDVHPTDDIASLSPDYTEDHNLNHDHDDQHPRNNSKDGSAEEVSTSEILKPATPTGWDTNEIKEQYASTTTVVSSSDVKHEDSTHDSLIHVVHPGWDNEVRYSANDTRDDVLPGTVSPGDGEHYSADEKDNNLEEETFHAAVFVNGSAKDEESHQDQLLSAGKPGRRRGGGSSTNRTSHGVVQILIPPSESDRENKSARTDSNQDQLAGGNDGSSSQNEHEQESSDSDELSNDVMKHEESTPNPLTHGMQWDSHEQYSTNTSSEETLPGIISPSENEHKNTSVYTVLDSIDGTEHEDVTNHPAVHDVEHEWSRKDEYPTNSTKDEERLAIFPLPDNNNEEKGFHTAVIHNNEAHHEDATQEPLPPVHHPDWHTEEEYSTNTSRDDILMGISANSGNEPDPLHPDEVSHGGTQDEDSTPEPVKLDSEDKYSTHSKEGVLPPGIVPRRGTNHKNNTYHAGLVPNQPEDRGSQQGDSTPKTQPRAAHIPDWLIVVASLLALALILGVCIAVNSRRRCGQKQKLVINNGKGVVDNKNMGGLNGEASKSHEMVHLVHKEQPEDQTGPHDEFLQIDETNNLQEVDLKSDVQAIHAIPVEPELAE